MGQPLPLPKCLEAFQLWAQYRLRWYRGTISMGRRKCVCCTSILSAITIYNGLDRLVQANVDGVITGKSILHANRHRHEYCRPWSGVRCRPRGTTGGHLCAFCHILYKSPTETTPERNNQRISSGTKHSPSWCDGNSQADTRFCWRTWRRTPGIGRIIFGIWPNAW